MVNMSDYYMVRAYVNVEIKITLTGGSDKDSVFRVVRQWYASGHKSNTLRYIRRHPWSEDSFTFFGSALQ